MRPLTAEWISKAEGDLATAVRECDVQRDANYDAVCFHAQQCVEKYLKARLQEDVVRFGKTHDLVALLDLLVPTQPSWERFRDSMRRLTLFAVEVRYPGTAADEPSAAEALELCHEVRACVRSSFPLDE